MICPKDCKPHPGGPGAVLCCSSLLRRQEVCLWLRFFGVYTHGIARPSNHKQIAPSSSHQSPNLAVKAQHGSDSNRVKGCGLKTKSSLFLAATKGNVAMPTSTIQIKWPFQEPEIKKTGSSRASASDFQHNSPGDCHPVPN